MKTSKTPHYYPQFPNDNNKNSNKQIRLAVIEHKKQRIATVAVNSKLNSSRTITEPDFKRPIMANVSEKSLTSLQRYNTKSNNYQISSATAAAAEN